MNHMEAVNGQSVKRYLLNEMLPAEAETFELHYYECDACTEELEIGTSLMESAREMVAKGEVVLARPAEPPKSRAPWWRQPMFAAPAFAAALLAGVVFYQTGELASLQRPRALTAYILKSELRGGTQNPIPLAGDVEVDFDLPDDSGFGNFRGSVYNQSGQRVFWLDFPAPQQGKPAGILVPSGSVKPGTYTLKVEGLQNGNAGAEIAHWKFELKPR